ncbi:CesT family type III secretion system chaperone [Candidatus Similichlamydia epinepheli]|uniref:CesT family type III secretion system chaperone n=1 Tax=Candidatus Similichlamydia epinepheli TaxID=1903953 RepID=UPI001300289F|nr:CesT family type III secretion system chaperone [Candidatus Similichlamydia epinepheli]
MYYLPFENLIKELAWTGSNIELNGSSSCEITTEEGLRISIEADQEKPIIQAVCFLGVVSKTKDSNPLLMRLLKENLSPNDGEVFGIDLKSNQFTIHKSISFENINSDSFVSHLVKLHNKGIAWSKIIEGKESIPDG